MMESGNILIVKYLCTGVVWSPSLYVAENELLSLLITL